MPGPHRFNTHADVMAQIMSNSELAEAVHRGGLIPSHTLIHLVPGAQHEGFTEADLRAEFASWLRHKAQRHVEPFGSWQLAWNVMLFENGGVLRLTPSVCQRCHGRAYSVRDATRGGRCMECHGSRRASPVTMRMQRMQVPSGPENFGPGRSS